MPGEQKKNSALNLFQAALITLLAVFVVIKWIVPFLSRYMTGLSLPLPVPDTLMNLYLVLTLIALFLYITIFDEGLDEFLRPLKKLFRGEYGVLARNSLLTSIPFVAGLIIYNSMLPQSDVPPSIRLQHPSSNFPRQMENIKNPFAHPSNTDVDAFIQQAKANEIDFIPQVRDNIEEWRRANSSKHMLAFLPAPQVRRFIDEINSGNVSRDIAMAVLVEKNLFEGRALYAINCAPCHGSSTAGDGPMAGGFKLGPIDFTDSGTIETIVEGYAFWRVAKGGQGLPAEATPWDSAMPAWEGSLTEAEMWKIIMAEYELAGKTPRRVEGEGADSEI